MCDGSSNCYHLHKKALLEASTAGTSAAPSPGDGSSGVGQGISSSSGGAGTSSSGTIGSIGATNGCSTVAITASSDDDTEEDGSELSESEMESDYCFLQVGGASFEFVLGNVKRLCNLLQLYSKYTMPKISSFMVVASSPTLLL